MTALESKGDRVLGVRCDTESIRCDEVVLCAGTPRNCGDRFASGLATGPLRVVEHREMLVHYRLRHSPGRPTVAPNGGTPHLVVRSAGGRRFCRLHRRCPTTRTGHRGGRHVPGTPGTLVWDGATLTVDLGSAPDLPAPGPRTRPGPGHAEFRGLPGHHRTDRCARDPVVRTSQHASGSLPMGDRTDRFGALDGVHGLRIVDGSILPPGGRSGPHATTVMVAALSS